MQEIKLGVTQKNHTMEHAVYTSSSLLVPPGRTYRAEARRVGAAVATRSATRCINVVQVPAHVTRTASSQAVSIDNRSARAVSIADAFLRRTEKTRNNDRERNRLLRGVPFSAPLYTYPHTTS